MMIFFWNFDWDNGIPDDWKDNQETHMVSILEKVYEKLLRKDNKRTQRPYSEYRWVVVGKVSKREYHWLYWSNEGYLIGKQPYEELQPNSWVEGGHEIEGYGQRCCNIRDLGVWSFYTLFV